LITVGSGSFISDPAHWRQRGKEMRALAEDVLDFTARQTMLRIASDYERLAARADEGADGIANRNQLGDSFRFRRSCS